MTTGAIADSGIVGRVGELAAISSAVADGVAGRAWVVWIEGDAGAGKTALLRAALGALPEEFTVLRAEADELAGDIPFHLVQQLGVGTTTGAFPAGLELLAIWGRAEEGGPVAVAVEDLHWADSGSRLALLAAVRRLEHDRVIVLVTSRPDPLVADGWERLCFDPDRCLRVALGPLSPAEVAEMARRSGVRLPVRAAERLCHHTGGHPLYVRTLLSELTPEQLTAAEGELPAPRSLAMTMVARLAELPPDARTLAAALAVVNQRISLPAAAEVAGIGQPVQALDDLLTTGFVTSQPGGHLLSVEYAHPLYRAAVYAGLAPSQRQELHRRAAGLIGGEAALAHRVAAADSADDALADQADGASRAEAARRRLALAARYLLWASELSSRPEDAQTRLLRAARLLLTAEQTRAVEELRPRIEACPPSALRSLVLGVLTIDHGDAVAAEPLLANAAGLTSPGQLSGGFLAVTETAADALAQLSTLYGWQVRTREAIAAAAGALAYTPAEPGVQRTAATIEALGQGMLRGASAGLERLAARLPARAGEVPPADVDLLIIRGTLHYYAGQLAPAVSDLRAAVRLARQGPAAQLPRAHIHLAQLLFYTGEWDEALVQGHVALSLLSDERLTWVEAQAHAALSWVLASKGQWAGAGEQLASAETVAGELGTAEARETTLMARAALARARGEPGRIIEALSGLSAQTELGQAVILGMWYPLLVAALIDRGDVKTAREKLAWLRRQATERGFDFASSIVGLQARLTAADGETGRARAEFRQAIELLSPNDPLLDRALLHHAFGRLLHACGDRRLAVDQLRSAHELLTGVGAAPFLARVDADLTTAGTPAAAAAGRGSPLGLTARESDVVALVAKGLTNNEVGAELYVSTKAVEYHLGNVFAKLGIRSRRELRQFAF